MEKINVFIVAMPNFDGIVEKIKNAVEDAFDFPKPKKPCLGCHKSDDFIEEDFTPKRFKLHKSCNGVQPWGVGGKKANENLRFGYQAPPIDEPRCQDYDCRWKFEDDHKAYDKLVDAAEDCIARGLTRPEGVVEYKCNAIRKPIGCPPPMKNELPSELIGETQWWCEEPDWDF